MQEEQTRNFADTKQGEKWRGEFGSEYSLRNEFSTPDLDKLYKRNHGTTRTELNLRFLADIPKSASILEIGCNLGNQLILLHEMGFQNLNGIEIQREIVKQAQSRLPGSCIVEGSALKVPFADASFDLVFTSGLLIHIAPQDLPVAMNEIYRCAKHWIWGFEYYSPQMIEVPYRGQIQLLWKADYARLYTKMFADLELVSEQHLKYLENDNVDSMFLLRKK
ncbi:MAG TPA: pseudaminic acid biosynthesis-associated methylase [Terriglobales bacterium]|jgi:pseudaminic acid biosynthesis-associated methylase|nr:pseudaminic acid biosynthesis-associated methylase [Terriglobales bacterium]